MTPRIVQIALVTSSAVVFDQLTKWIILQTLTLTPSIRMTPFFSLTLGFNTGVSFGMFREALSDWPMFLAIFKVSLAIIFFIWAARTDSNLERIGLGLIAGGALGNAIDRWRQGAVTDFLDFHWADWRWPTFNFADVAITLGVTAMVWASLFCHREKQKQLADDRP